MNKITAISPVYIVTNPTPQIIDPGAAIESIISLVAEEGIIPSHATKYVVAIPSMYFLSPFVGAIYRIVPTASCYIFRGQVS